MDAEKALGTDKSRIKTAFRYFHWVSMALQVCVRELLLLKTLKYLLNGIVIVKERYLLFRFTNFAVLISFLVQRIKLFNM